MFSSTKSSITCTSKRKCLTTITDTSDNLSTINRNDIREIIAAEKPSSGTEKNKAKKAIPRWKLDDDKVEALSENLIAYKNEMSYKGLDFQADLVECYSEVRKMMAQMYSPVDFGPENIPLQDTDDMDDDELVQYKRKVERLEKQKKDGYTRIKAKVKELRSGYKVAIDKGTRSGSGRLICNNFDKLQEIWGRNPCVSSLPNALCSHPLPREENDESEALDLEETGANEKITPTPVKPRAVRDNKRDHRKKTSLPIKGT